MVSQLWVAYKFTGASSWIPSALPPWGSRWVLNGNPMPTIPMKPVVGPISVCKLSLHEITFCEFPFLVISCKLSLMIDGVSSSELLYSDCVILGKKALQIRAPEESITDELLAVIFSSLREWSKPVKITEVFHARWVININHKTLNHIWIICEIFGQ